MTARVQTETVWELLSARLKSFIRSRVEDDQTAEDLLQETFLRIHQRLGTLGDEERIEAWVFQIARHLIADHYRARGRSPQQGPLGSEPAEWPAGAVSSNQNEAIARWLPLAIEALPSRYRDAVRMYELEGISQAEIAEKLGLSLSGAKSRVQRGREKLKRTLELCCQFDLDRRGNVLSCEPRNQDCAYCG